MSASPEIERAFRAGWTAKEMSLAGEHPEFSPEELAEIRRLAHSEWQAVHRVKNETAVPSHRDRLTERLLTLERIEEKTR